MELGHVVLYVTDVAKIAAFYRDTLGFAQIAREPGVAIFSSGRTHHELLLIEVGGQPKAARAPEPGLYHIGFKIGDSTEDLKAAYKELRNAGVRVLGATDHGVTHSLYILDPDGNELELYADVSDAWKKDPSALLSPARALDLS
ncbi:MAG: Glyoxalase/bleomycin resistance protein/dioxygenase [Parcubacteria group bacterium]|nr:Glyoxalase/bleomycin resistance protein/dioxygenase [Parcubacteria group bacterium]